MNIRSSLLNNFDFRKSDEKFDNNESYNLKIGDNSVKLYLLNNEMIYADDINKKINADFFVFISRHVSKENTPAFTAHSIGNWGNAEFGGKSNTLCPSSAVFLKRVFLELAEKVLRKVGEENFSNLKIEDLKGISGLGPVKSCEIIACFELGKRLLKDKKIHIYLKPRDVWNELKDIRDHKKEHCVIFYLDTRNQEIKREIVSIGTLNYSLVHPREVFEPAVKNLAASVILAHNHPSGALEPSGEDITLNKRLVEAGKILGIEVLDHVIVSKEGFSSFKEKGLM